MHVYGYSKLAHIIIIYVAYIGIHVARHSHMIMLDVLYSHLIYSIIYSSIFHTYAASRDIDETNANSLIFFT